MDCIKRLFAMTKAHRSHLIWSVVIASFSVIVGIIPYFIIHRFIGHLIDNTAIFSELLVLAVVAGIMLVIKTVSFSIATLMSHEVAFEILRNIRIKLAEKLIRLPMGYVLEQDSGVIKKVMENDVEELERFLAHNIPEAISGAIVPLGVLTYLLFVDWRLTVALVVLVPFAMVFYKAMAVGGGDKMKKHRDSVNRMNAVVVEFVNGIKEIKTFNKGKESFGRYQDAVKQYRDHVLDWFKICWPLETGFYISLQTPLFAVLPVGLLLLNAGEINLATLVLFALVSMGISPPLMKISDFVNGYQMLVHAEENVHKLLSLEEMEEGDKGKPDNYDVVFDNVSFSYIGEKDAVSDISFVAKEGTKTALIGLSGSGKSTIAKLLCRFFDIQKGNITIGGIDICDMSHKALSQTIAFVFQDTFLMNISVLENIKIGKPNATDEEAIEAAKKANCHKFIMSKPEGYNTLAGDGGNHFSGGEKQRICIARAILKDAPILVLDEATASVDSDSEEQIQQALGELIKNKTLLVIAHRIRTIVSFEQIIMLSYGKIIAKDKHDVLLQSSEFYKEMYETYMFNERWKMNEMEVSENVSND